MGIYDKDLEQDLLQKFKSLEMRIDYLAPTPLRHKLSEQLVNMRKELVNFDQDAWEPSTVGGGHDWVSISPGLYDDLYKCSKCGLEHTVQADNTNTWELPKTDCNIKDEKLKQQHKDIGSHDKNCNCYFCDPQV